MKSPIVLLVEQQKRRKILKRRRNRMLRQSWIVGSRRKNKSIIKGKELRKMAVLSPFMVFTHLCLPRHHPVNHRLLFLTRFHQVNPGCLDAVVS